MKSFAIISIFSVLIVVTIPMVASAQIAPTTDNDGDGLSDVQEIATYQTDPQNADTDGDGYLDGEEVKHGYSPKHNSKKLLRQTDTDSDGLWDDWEVALGTDLGRADTDGDGYKDGEEVGHGYNPLSNNKEKLPKRIEVNIKNQSLQYFFGNIKLDDFKISGGLPRTPTPTGKFLVIKQRPFVHTPGPG